VGYSDDRATGWAYAGRWLVSTIDAPVWGAGGSVGVGRGVRLEVSLQQEAPDPLYWNPARRYWSVGFVRTFGRAPAAATVAPVIPETRGGRVLLRVPLEESAAAPAVGGDFNGWKPVPMARAGDHWEIRLPLEPGVYRYAFRRPDGSWFVPDATPGRQDDGFGGVNAVLVVPAASR
jgi:hypothetical protein